MRAGGGETEGKRAGEDPHPKAELQRQRSSEVVAATVTEARQERWQRLGLREREARLRV
jgi:hypothetical protein